MLVCSTNIENRAEILNSPISGITRSRNQQDAPDFKGLPSGSEQGVPPNFVDPNDNYEEPAFGA